jgi:flagellar motor switch protein FliM
MSGGNILTQEELDALFNGDDTEEQEHNKDFSEYSVRVYDFRTPNKFSKELLRVLKTIYKNMSKMASAFLSVYLRQDIKFELNNIGQKVYHKFIEKTKEDTLYYLVSFVNDKAIVGIDANVSFLLVEKLLGGTGTKTGIYRNEPTQIEIKVISNILEEIFALQKESWGEAMARKSKIIKYDDHPKIIQLCKPNDAVLVVKLEIIIGDEVGNMFFCVPYSAIENVEKLLVKEESTESNNKSSDKDKKNIIKNINDAVVPITSILGQTDISVQDVLSIKKGDVLDLGINVSSPIVIKVGEFKKFSGDLGISNKKYAIKINQIHF